MKKILGLVFIPGLIMAVVFVLWGDSFESSLNQQAFVDKYDPAEAWLVAIGLILSDLFLPIPASGIMAAIGSIYGIGLGFTINFCSFLSAGLIAYGLARVFSHKGARWICSDEELENYKGFFDRWGGHSIIISRLFPILPEVTSLLAGFSKMNFKKYVISLIFGTLPVSFLYTWLGHASKEEPFWGILISVFTPLIIWFLLSNKISFNKNN